MKHAILPKKKKRHEINIVTRDLNVPFKPPRSVRLSVEVKQSNKAKQKTKWSDDTRIG